MIIGDYGPRAGPSRNDIKNSLLFEDSSTATVEPPMMKPAAVNTPCFRPPLLLACVPRHNPCFLPNNGLFSGLSIVSLPNARAFSLTVRATENSNQVIFLNSIYYVKIS